MLLMSATAMLSDPGTIDRIGRATGCGDCRVVSEARSVMSDVGALRNVIVGDLQITQSRLVLQFRQIGDAIQTVVAATA